MQKQNVQKIQAKVKPDGSRTRTKTHFGSKLKLKSKLFGFV